MNTIIFDRATVPTQETTIFQTIQQGVTDAQWTLRNVSGSTINYRAQINAGGSAWSDIGVLGTDTHNTLSVSQVKLVPVAADYPQVRLLAYAGTESVLEFSIARQFNRASGGNLPILTF
jgi:hypothetical protein